MSRDNKRASRGGRYPDRSSDSQQNGRAARSAQQGYSRNTTTSASAQRGTGSYARGDGYDARDPHATQRGQGAASAQRAARGSAGDAFPASRASRSGGGAQRASRSGGHGSHAQNGRRAQTQMVPQNAQNRYGTGYPPPYDASATGRGKGKNKKKMKSSKKVLITIIVVFCVLILGGVGTAGAYIIHLNKSLQFDSKEASKLDAVLQDTAAPTDPFWMLLMGTDDEEGTTRTDSIILARINPDDMDAVLISIPRDTRVYIDGYGYQKINAAHAWGGPSLAVEVISQFAGVPISHYAELNFNSFYDLVDALGGVEVDVPVYVTATDDEGVSLYYNSHDLEPGLQTLDGASALVFCRSRYYANGDFQRQANQRIFLKAMADKILNSDLQTILSAAGTIASAVSTDMSADTIYQIASALKGLNMDDIYTYTVPSGADMIDGISYVVASDSEWRSMITTIEAGGFPPTQDSSIAGTVGEEYQNQDAVNSAAGSTGDSMGTTL